MLYDGPFAPSRVTLVLGNHDFHSSPNGWRRAIAGRLRAFAETSARPGGDVVEAAGVTLLPVDVTVHQPVTMAAGELAHGDADCLGRFLADRASRDRPVVLVQHPPPLPRRFGLWQWIDGLRDWPRLARLLGRHPELQVLHGHLHEVVNRGLGHARVRVFGAPAVVEEKGGAPRTRLYEARDGTLSSLESITA